MKKVGIFYGSSTGTTQDIAEQIGKKLGVAGADIKDMADASVDDFSNYEVLLLGSSTWGDGDLQDEWEEVLSDLKSVDLTGKLVGLFGCGDCSSYAESFCSAIGLLYKALDGSNCTFIGAVSPEGYDFEDSEALVNGEFIGLPIDEDNDSNLTEERINNWIEILKPHLA